MRLRNGVIPGVNDHPGMPRSSSCVLSPHAPPDTKYEWHIRCPKFSGATRVHHHQAYDIYIRGCRLRDEPTCTVCC